MIVPLSLSALPLEALDDVWPALEPMIERGLKHGQGDGMTADSLKAELRRGDLCMWIAQDEAGILAGMVIRVVQHPAKKTVFIEMLAGKNMNEWLDKGFDVLKEFRDMIDADTIEASCRPGMARALEQLGWRRKALIMEAPA